jgi:hypothetical protein
MQMIVWRTHGVKNAEIAKRLGLCTRYMSTLMGRVFRKAGVDDVALLTRWAMATGMDEDLEPETEETREIMRPKVYRKKISLGRIRQTGLTRRASPEAVGES